MKQLKCWLISTVFLVSLFGGSGAIALDLLNLSDYADGSPVPYGKNVIVVQDAATGKKWLNNRIGTNLLAFSNLNVSSGDIEIVVEFLYFLGTQADFSLKLISGENYIIFSPVSFIFPFFEIKTETAPLKVFYLEELDIQPDNVTRLKLSISGEQIKLYNEETGKLLSEILLEKPFPTYFDLEVKINSDPMLFFLYDLTINADSEFDKGKQAGIQQCVTNPDSCGITSGGGSAIKLINISTRATIQGGDNDVIAGFIIRGTGSQKVVIGGWGLEEGVNPKLTVRKYPSSEFVASNDDWQVQTAPSSAIPDQIVMVQATDAALLLTLPAGAYTAIMSSVGVAGLGLIGVNAID